MPIIKLEIEKKIDDMSIDELKMYVKQLETENGNIKTEYEDKIKTITDGFNKEIEKVKNNKYNMLLGQPIKKDVNAKDDSIDFKELVS